MKRFMDPRIAVLFPVPNGDGTLESEYLWAQDLGHDRYRIANCPFFVDGVSLHDIVLAPRVRGIPTFERVLSKSGNRTVRILFNEPVATGNAPERVLRRLVSFGCAYEGADRTFVAVNIPARVLLIMVYEYLDEQDVTWEHADPAFDEVNICVPL
ncbi:MAG TPA: DUF4265 domain-containing protein [Gammaproteobacteria bacterium]|nr:DUF4265 domain-containing protein [Gammaproteobacteria bacterium]